jgi:hypothetical protein
MIDALFWYTGLVVWILSWSAWRQRSWSKPMIGQSWRTASKRSATKLRFDRADCGLVAVIRLLRELQPFRGHLSEKDARVIVRYDLGQLQTTVGIVYISLPLIGWFLCHWVYPTPLAPVESMAENRLSGITSEGRRPCTSFSRGSLFSAFTSSTGCRWLV